MNHRNGKRKRFPHRSKDGVAYHVQRLPYVDEQTGGETLYLNHLIRNKTPVVVKLLTEEEVHGWIEYYDRSFIRVTRKKAPNVFIYKEKIKYIQEA
ncbi:MAG: hypothetical protein AB1898_12360 [Acidobacteriota bacterium]